MAGRRPYDPSLAMREVEEKARARAPEGTGAREGEIEREPVRLLRALKLLGPGLIAGASDDDPTAIATYASAGASFGYAALWTALFTFPMMAAVQYVAAKIGLASGVGLAGLLRRHYSRWLYYPAILGLLVANTINAGADIGAIAAAFNLIVPIPVAALVIPVALGLIVLQVFAPYRLIANVFRLLAVLLLAYVGAAVLALPDLGQVLRATFLPTLRFDAAFVATLVAILGTNISPYLFFWQASEEVEEKASRGRRTVWQRRGTSDTELTYAAWDVNLGMFFSNLVIYFVNLACAATLHAAGKTSIGSAAEAAQALRPLAGDAASLLFAVGLIGSGFLAAPVLTASAGYAMAETFGWRSGLNEAPGRAREFYAVIVLATAVGMLINFLGINPIGALFWSAVLNGVLAPPLLVLVMLIANNRRVMGDRVNTAWTNVLGWGTTAVMFAAAVGLFLTMGNGS
jgi:NRAMP (natural resistance-associated macrophage protein)-like metal ion transporter